MAIAVYPDERLPAAVDALATQVEADGGRTLAIYREPVGGHWQIFALLPIDKVAPTPYQRDLSPTHAKRLQEMVRRSTGSWTRSWSSLRARACTGRPTATTA